MKIAVRFPLLLLLAALPWGGQHAAAQAPSPELEEVRRLAGQVEDLRAALEAQQTRITSLTREVETLRGSIRRQEDATNAKLADFATRGDLRTLANSIEEVDRKRLADVHKFGEMVKKEISAAVAPPARPAPRETSTPTAIIEGTFYPHKVGPGQTFSAILDAYNAKFVAEGKRKVTFEEVKKANPKISNFNRIFVGQEILIPDPSN